MVQLDLFGFPVEEKPAKKQEPAAKRQAEETRVSAVEGQKEAEPTLFEATAMPASIAEEIKDEVSEQSAVNSSDTGAVEAADTKIVEEAVLNTATADTVDAETAPAVEQNEVNAATTENAEIIKEVVEEPVAEADDIIPAVEPAEEDETPVPVANNDTIESSAAEDESEARDEDDDTAQDEDVIVFSRPLFSKPVMDAIEVPRQKPTAAVKGRRGRKSFKEIDAEIALVEVPDDEILHQKMYYSISQVAKWFNVNTSLLRFWENEFDILKPRKNRKGDRMFRPEDIKNLQVIYYLLRQRKFSIEGAKKYIKQNKNKAEVNIQLIQSLTKFRSFLLEMKANLGA